MDILLKESLLNPLGFQCQDRPSKDLCWPSNNEMSITRKGHGVFYLIQKNCKKWSGSPDWSDRLWPAKAPLERSHSVSGYPVAVTGVRKSSLFLQLQGSVHKSNKAQGPSHRESSWWLSLASALGKITCKNQPGVRKQAFGNGNTQALPLTHRTEPGSEMTPEPARLGDA